MSLAENIRRAACVWGEKPLQNLGDAIQNTDKTIGDQTEALGGGMHLIVPVLLVVPSCGQSPAQIHVMDV